MPSYIFYPPPMPQGSVPPLVKVPIPVVPPAPDNPPLVSQVYRYIIKNMWEPGPVWAGNLHRPTIPIIPLDSTGDNPFFRRENTIDRINLSWYTPYIAYQTLKPIAPFLRSPDNPPIILLQYPRSIYTQYQELNNWSVVKHRPTKDIFSTPGIIPPVPSSTFQVNVNMFSVRHSISIEVNNNLNLQNVNQGSTFIFTIHAFHRRGFPRVVSQVDAVSLILKDSLGNVVVSSGVTTKEENTFSYTYQLDSNAPKGPWSIQAIASFSTDVRITPFTVCFTVI